MCGLMYITMLFRCKVTKISWNIGANQPIKCPLT